MIEEHARHDAQLEHVVRRQPPHLVGRVVVSLPTKQRVQLEVRNILNENSNHSSGFQMSHYIVS